MIQLRRIRELGKRLMMLSAASAVVWLLHSEAPRGMLHIITYILAKVR